MNKSINLLEVAKKNLLTITSRPNIIMDKGKGMYLWDTEGKKYLDFIGGWAVCSLGHSPKVISKILSKQSKKLINSSPSFFNKPMLRFTNLLIENSVFDRVWFGCSGAEVNEAAIKLARKFGSLEKNNAYKIITTNKGFHGRTLAMMSATGKEQWKDLFNPKPSGFIHVPFNNLDAIKSEINDQVAAIMVEPIQGEGGVNLATLEYFKGLRSICDKNNILLIFDEVQTGFGRTGTLFTYEQYNIEPDIMTLAKGIGGGYPLSAILVKERLNIFEAGEQGGTFGGQQLAMAVGISVLKEILDKNILDNVVSTGKYILNELNKIKSTYNLKNIRGKGLLIGFDLPKDNARYIVNECLKRGLIINATSNNSIRLIPALIVSKRDVDWMIYILRDVLNSHL